jgi:hypothetical protein
MLDPHYALLPGRCMWTRGRSFIAGLSSFI